MGLMMAEGSIMGFDKKRKKQQQLHMMITSKNTWGW